MSFFRIQSNGTAILYEYSCNASPATVLAIFHGMFYRVSTTPFHHLADTLTVNKHDFGSSYYFLDLTHCLLVPFGTHRQITVEANVAGGYINTENILILKNLQWMLSDQLCKS